GAAPARSRTAGRRGPLRGSRPVRPRPGAGAPEGKTPVAGPSMEPEEPCTLVGSRARPPMDALERDLRAAVKGEVRFDDGSRALYATDSSNYRQVPIGVVVPQDVEDAVRAIEVGRRHGAPLLSRGGGTSLAGQCCNVAVVLDWSKRVNRILEINAEEHYAWVEPGVVLDDLRRAAERHGLTFGPDPSTHNR